MGDNYDHCVRLNREIESNVILINNNDNENIDDYDNTKTNVIFNYYDANHNNSRSDDNGTDNNKKDNYISKNGNNIENNDNIDDSNSKKAMIVMIIMKLTKIMITIINNDIGNDIDKNHDANNGYNSDIDDNDKQ